MIEIIPGNKKIIEPRGVKAAIIGPPGAGKTSLLRTMDLAHTLFVDIEAGDLAVQDLAIATTRPDSWPAMRDLACLIGGPNPSVPSTCAYSEAHFNSLGGVPPWLAPFDTVFIDSLTAAARVCYAYCEQQPESFSERTGNKDTRATFGLLGREMIAWLNQFQRARDKNIIFVAILETVIDDFKQPHKQIQLEGQKTARELPGIVDLVVALDFIDFGDGDPVRSFITTSPNPWALPCKDRSGRLEQIEEPHLGKLIAKIIGR